MRREIQKHESSIGVNGRCDLVKCSLGLVAPALLKDAAAMAFPVVSLIRPIRRMVGLIERGIYLGSVLRLGIVRARLLQPPLMAKCTPVNRRNILMAIPATAISATRYMVMATMCEFSVVCPVT
jgi:hypothetical protein